jgi:galactose mutarotase-like enzyme
VPFHQVTVSGFPAVSLRAGEVEAVVIPGLGLKVSNLRRGGGREWLWRSDQIPLAPPTPGASYVETADSGGWDECFPTVGPSMIPGRPDAPPLPDHGELWSARWESAVYERNGSVTIAGRALSERFPCEFIRELTLVPDEPVVRLRYALRHLGGDPFPWIWSSHPLLTVQPGSLLQLPGVTQVKVDAAHGRPDLEVDDLVSWPGGIGGRQEAFEFPALDREPWAAKMFADAGGDRCAVLTDPRRGERLEFRVDRSRVPQVGVWINCAGWAPPGKRPYYNLALEPCIGAPDRLDRAAEWGLAQALAAGEHREWEVEVWLLEEGE